MPLTFRDRDGRKTCRFTTHHDLTVHEILNAVGWAVVTGRVDLAAITDEGTLRVAVQAALDHAVRHGPSPASLDAALEAQVMVVVARHVGREQALELLRPTNEDRENAWTGWSEAPVAPLEKPDGREGLEAE